MPDGIQLRIGDPVGALLDLGVGSLQELVRREGLTDALKRLMAEQQQIVRLLLKGHRGNLAGDVCLLRLRAALDEPCQRILQAEGFMRPVPAVEGEHHLMGNDKLIPVLLGHLQVGPAPGGMHRHFAPQDGFCLGDGILQHGQVGCGGYAAVGCDGIPRLGQQLFKLFLHRKISFLTKADQSVWFERLY